MVLSFYNDGQIKILDGIKKIEIKLESYLISNSDIIFTCKKIGNIIIISIVSHSSNSISIIKILRDGEIIADFITPYYCQIYLFDNKLLLLDKENLYMYEVYYKDVNINFCFSDIKVKWKIPYIGTNIIDIITKYYEENMYVLFINVINNAKIILFNTYNIIKIIENEWIKKIVRFRNIYVYDDYYIIIVDKNKVRDTETEILKVDKNFNLIQKLKIPNYVVMIAHDEENIKPRILLFNFTHKVVLFNVNNFTHYSFDISYKRQFYFGFYMIRNIANNIVLFRYEHDDNGTRYLGIYIPKYKIGFMKNILRVLDNKLNADGGYADIKELLLSYMYKGMEINGNCIIENGIPLEYEYIRKKIL